jgi:hypothetical protein
MMFLNNFKSFQILLNLSNPFLLPGSFFIYFRMKIVAALVTDIVRFATIRVAVCDGVHPDPSQH